jgi:Tol biopolymer transport system component
VEFPIGTVLYQTGGWIDAVRVSPDSAYIAFIDHPVDDDDRGAVAVIQVADGHRRVLSDGWASVTGLAWSASGEEIWFTAAEVGAATSLYAVTLSGRVSAVLRSAGRLTIQDVDRRGRVLLTESKFRLRVGAVDMQASDQKERDLSWLDASVVTDVSADGSTLVINEQGVGARTPLYAVYIRKIDGSPATRIGEGALPMLSPDGRWVAAVLQSASPSITLLPTGAGQPRTLDRGTLVGYQSVTWFPDARRVLVAGNEADRGIRLWVQDVADGGTPTPVTKEGLRIAFPSQPISPDGSKVATLDQDERVWLHSLTGDQDTRLVDGLEAGDIPIRWHADGQSFYVFRYGELPAIVYRFHLKERRKDQVAALTPSDRAGVGALMTIQTTPDGRLFLYTYSQTLSDLLLVTEAR